MSMIRKKTPYCQDYQESLGIFPDPETNWHDQ